MKFAQILLTKEDDRIELCLRLTPKVAAADGQDVLKQLATLTLEGWSCSLKLAEKPSKDEVESALNYKELGDVLSGFVAEQRESCL